MRATDECAAHPTYRDTRAVVTLMPGLVAEPSSSTPAVDILAAEIVAE
jgi:hypothetical protein